MNRRTEENEETGKPAKPIIRKMRWHYAVIWLIPVCAAIAAGFYVRDYLTKRGTEITIVFTDGSGLKEGETKVMHRGVEVGRVETIELTGDQRQVVAHVRLSRSGEAYARKGARFWTVRPEISGGSITGLTTVLSGPYIDTMPGAGEKATAFTALEKSPIATDEGLRVVLRAQRVEHLQEGSPVYYKGIEVGAIQDIELSDDATGVDVHLFIQPRYGPLVRANSQFWFVSAVDLRGGLFTGVHMQVESLRTLISGGIAFATPEEKMGVPAQNGSLFRLVDEAKKEWLTWSPAIKIGPAKPWQQDEQDKGLPNSQDMLNSAMKAK